MSARTTGSVVVVGAGMAGLVAAALLASRGLRVTVLDRAARPGGKLRQVAAGAALVDSGPTVLTLAGILDEIFRAAGSRLGQHVTLQPLSVLARHAWPDGSRLDLHADAERSADAIAAFAGTAEAERYRAFCARARRSYAVLNEPFLRQPRPTLPGLLRGVGVAGLLDLWRARPMTSLWQVLGEHFRDPRLRQLFARYATYSGASPFLAPATLMVIAHVEQMGVWRIAEGGMQRLAESLEAVATGHGASFRGESEMRDLLVRDGRAAGVVLADGETVAADAVLVTADAAAVAQGALGDAAAAALGVRPAPPRSLSAVTWSMHVETEGFPLLHHSVFFSGDYRAEFDDILQRGRLPREPTVYVCAADRGDEDDARPRGKERLFCLVNAPANGDRKTFSSAELEECETRTFQALHRAGLSVRRASGSTVRTTPADFHRLFPGTGGALYGPAQHGWQASFSRPGVRTRLPRLYLAGGSIHPGPGLPMVALSGRQAASAMIADLASMLPSRPVAMPGGISTR